MFCTLCGNEILDNGHCPLPFGTHDEKCCATCYQLIKRTRESTPAPDSQVNPVYPYRPPDSKLRTIEHGERCGFCTCQLVDGIVCKELPKCNHLYHTNCWQRCLDHAHAKHWSRFNNQDDEDWDGDQYTTPESRCFTCNRDAEWADWVTAKDAVVLINKQMIIIDDTVVKAEQDS